MNNKIKIFRYKNLFIEQRYLESEGFLKELIDKLDKYKNYRTIRNYLDNLFVIDYPDLQTKHYSKCVLLDNREQIALDSYLFFLETLNDKLEQYYIENPNRIVGSLNHIYRYEEEAFAITKIFIRDIISQ